MEEEIKEQREGSIIEAKDNSIAEWDIAGLIRNSFHIKEENIQTYSPLTLAYIGDAVYDIIVRTILVERANAPVNKLHRKASSLVKASAQAEAVEQIKPYMTEDEYQIYKRGRNAKSFTTAKNASIIEYRIATGLEALIGYLYLNGKTERVIELVKIGLAKENKKK